LLVNYLLYDFHQGGRERHPHRAVGEHAGGAHPVERRVDRTCASAAGVDGEDFRALQGDGESRELSNGLAAGGPRVGGTGNSAAWSCASPFFPTVRGEKIVVRLFDPSNRSFDLASLGFDEDTQRTFLKLLARPSGLLLLTGPTGSGKTTAIYSRFITSCSGQASR